MNLSTHLLLPTVCLLLVSPAVAQDVIEAKVLPQRPSIVAHRGLQLHVPENTLGNFRACLELRLGFEFDVQATSDEQLICLHDATVDRTTNVSGKVTEMTLAEVRKLEVGSWFDRQFQGVKIPSVDELFALLAEYPDHDGLIAVDIKVAGAEKELIRLANKHKVLSRLLFIGKTITEPEVRAKLRTESAEANIAALAQNRDGFKQALEAEHANWVYFRFIPSEEQLDQLAALNKRAFIAGNTVSGNLPDNWRQVTKLGIDAVLTDYPLELRTTLKDIEAEAED